MSDDKKTPPWVDYLINRLAPDHFAEEIGGDLYELFIKDVNERGVRIARTKYVFNGLGFLFKSFFWKRSHTHSNTLIMLGSYFKMAIRSLMAYKGTAIINTLGLVVGIASALVILTVIKYELSFDAFHTKSDRTYRMVRVSGKDMSEFRTGISYPVPVAMKEEMSSLENIVSMEYFGGANVDVLDKSGNSVRVFREENGAALVEQGFFDVFDFRGTNFKWLAGNPANALVEPLNVVLTRSMAKKYFGDEESLGRTVRFQKRYDCKVTGVIEDLPANSDFPFTLLVSYSTLTKLASDDRLKDWVSVNDTHCTYVVLPEGTTKSEIEQQIAKVHAAHTDKELSGNRHYLLQELKELHFDPKFGNYNGRTITHQTILALGLIAAFLLLTGSINYVNLATAQSTLRAKEIGLRKVMGSSRSSLMSQFFMETFLIVLVSGVIALGLAEILLFNLQTLLNLRLTDYNFTDPFILGALLLIIIMITFFSGVYPSLVISRFNPIAALKNVFSTEKFAGFSFRKALVVVQFTITQILVVGTFIVVSQMRHFQNVDMGFNKDAIITVRIPTFNDPSGKDVLRNALLSQSNVAGVTFSSTLPSGVHRSRSYSDIGRVNASEMDDFHVYEYVSIDPEYLDLYKIRLLAGRNLSIQDSLKRILINRTLMKNLGWNTPEEAVGGEAKMNGRIVTIVGVIEDYYSNSLKEGVDNVVMIIDSFSVMSVKLDAKQGSLSEAVEKVGKTWSASFPGYVFNYEFLDENIKAFYAQEKKYAQMFQLFSIVFLSIGALGLYGLITFVVNRKGREVAIRKVLGATISQILFMFSKEYLQLILLSFALAIPVTYYAVDKWLQNFANHIELEWWLFVVPGLMVLVLALTVVVTKSMRTASANPVEKLKYE